MKNIYCMLAAATLGCSGPAFSIKQDAPQEVSAASGEGGGAGFDDSTPDQTPEGGRHELAGAAGLAGTTQLAQAGQDGSGGSQAGMPGLSGTPGSAGQGGGTAGTGPTGQAGTAPACEGDTAVGYSVPVPNVLVMVDRAHTAAQPISSGSSLTPWEITREALATSGTGLFSKYQSQVNFSFAVFSGPEDGVIGDPATTDYLETSECPHITRATFGVNNFLAISQTYKPAELGDATKGWAPFPESFESILPAFAGLEGPKSVIAILSKNPNGCEEPWDEAAALDRALGDIEAAYTEGITSYFIGIGNGLGVTEVAQPMANVGQGYPKNSEVNLSYQTTNSSQLDDALEDIMGRQVSCKIELDHTVLTDGRDGTVAIDGIKSFYGTGWQLTGEREIEFVDASCDQLKVSLEHKIEISFPCGSVEE